MDLGPARLLIGPDVAWLTPLQVQFIRLLFHGADHICVDQTGGRYVAANRY